ncbi:uncharacterized protein LOC141613639 [Silene latifolia]|uniref:uncharacterized protein LOC141613639 n=1 Tax=Silene latifolia TaxID=37657 RepID=UPI003D77367B
MTMIYDFNRVVERQELWEFLKNEPAHCDEPWLWTWDSITVLNPVERLGGNTTKIEMEQFQEYVSFCCIEDIQANGALFTWSNKQEPVDRVYSKLDRIMGNFEWMEEFCDYTTHFQPEGQFDHCPCTIADRKMRITGRRNFKYYNIWGQSDLFKECVRSVWQNKRRELMDNPGDMEIMQDEHVVAQELKGL